MAAAKKNPIWDYFQKSLTDPKTANCNRCRASISLGSAEPRRQTATNLVTHLKNRHSADFKVYQGKKEQNLSGPSGASASSSGQTASSSATTAPLLRQPSLKESLERSNPWPCDNPRSVELDTAVFNMIVLDCQPFSMVNDRGFGKLMQKAQPRYHVKSDKFYRELLPVRYEKAVKEIGDLLADVPAASFTTDIWTNEAGMCLAIF